MKRLVQSVRIRRGVGRHARRDRDRTRRELGIDHERADDSAVLSLVSRSPTPRRAIQRARGGRAVSSDAPSCPASDGRCRPPRRPATTIGPMTRARSSALIVPGPQQRRRRVIVRSMTVDSIPTLVAPPSRMMSTESSSDFATCAAGRRRQHHRTIGARCGDRDLLPRSSSARATGCAGTRTATDDRPAVTPSGTFGFLGSTIVSGPGQNARASISRRVRATPRRSCSASRARRDVDDQRIVRRASLGDVDPLDGGSGRARLRRVRRRSPLETRPGRRREGPAARAMTSALGGQGDRPEESIVD